MSIQTPETQPVVFIGHGSPMNLIEANPWTTEWERLGRELPRPRAILIISAHWYTRDNGVQSDPQPAMIYDMYGFPPPIYELQYPAATSPDLIARVQERLGSEVAAIANRGYDHGAYAPLLKMYPEADIPVVQLSSNAALDARAWFALGQNLAPLRQEGILIIGSGNIVHNLRQLNMAMSNRAYPECVAFDRAIASAVDPQRGNDLAAALHWEELPGASLAAAYPDHLSPFYYTLGAAMGSGDALPAVEILTQDYLMGTLSMTSYVWR